MTGLADNNRTPAVMSSPTALTPLGLTHDEFASAWKAAGYPGGAEAGRKAYSAFYREGDLAALPGPIRAATERLIAPIVRTHSEPCDEGVTVKFCQRLNRGRTLTADETVAHTLETARLETMGTGRRAADTLPLGILHQDERVEHLDIESVVIPMIGKTGRKTHTLCVSSQIGCAMACQFCETAQMGLIRSLTAQEIVGQWWAATWLLESPASAGESGPGRVSIDNIVFMGMGEPLDNFDAVIRAIACLTDDRGPGVAMSNVTISTVGRVDGLKRLVEVVRRPGWKRLGLALSVNAPNDAVRDTLMPINRKWDMGELQQVMRELVEVRASRKILFEYVLIPGINDSDEHAEDLFQWLRPFTRHENPSHIGLLNVIPYNPRRDSPWPAPDEDKVRHFVDLLAAKGVFVKRRRTKGRDQMAACGQLGTAEIRKRRFIAG
jgi:23S rRNA (adenine2503-C2)-methyltransferase